MQAKPKGKARIKLQDPEFRWHVAKEYVSICTDKMLQSIIINHISPAS